VSLLGEGIRVAKLTSRQVTERASLDKMYVSRFFGNLDGLLFAVLENLLAARMRSLISSDVFALGRPNTNVIRAFEIYSYLARDEELEPRLRQLAEVVIAVYKNQLSAEFGLEDKEAAREAVIGLVWLVGHLSVGHLMPMQPSELDSMMAGRRNQLRNRAR